jgi:hypothetical protein
VTIGEFAIGEATLCESAPAPPLPPAPPELFPSFSFGVENIKMRFTDPSVSEATNRKWLGMPRGVYAGFVAVQAAVDLLELQPDPIAGFSLLKVGSSAARATVDVFTEETIQLNFTGHTVYPVYVIGRSDYQLTGGTSARIFTRATPAAGQNEVQICLVTKDGDDFVIDATEPLIRQIPAAVPDQKYGFMIEGATSDLDSATTMAAEVEAARTDLTPTLQPSLNDRLVADMDGAAMTDRMALQAIHVQGNDYTIEAANLPLNTLNVSGSFSEASRTEPPFQTFPPNGSSTVEGAVAGPTDTSNNICPLVDATNGRRIVDTNGNLIYGRLDSATAALSGTMTFTVATPFVTGSGSAFLTELENGDLVQGADGIFYEVLDRTSNTELELTTAYQSESAIQATPIRRRYTLTMVSLTTGIELLTPVDAEVTLRFFHTVWARLDDVVANAFSVFKSRAELPPVPEATDSVAGKIKLATTGGLAGSIQRVEDNGLAVETDVHTLNFPVPGSVTDLGDGEAAISVIGDTGPAGEPGGVGPTGPAGVSGPGLTIRNSYIQSGISGTTSAAAGTVTLTHNVDFTAAPTPMTRVDHLTGGISLVQWFRPNEIIIIDHIVITDAPTPATIGEIEARIIPNPNQSTSNIKLFLGAFGA